MQPQSSDVTVSFPKSMAECELRFRAAQQDLARIQNDSRSQLPLSHWMFESDSHFSVELLARSLRDLLASDFQSLEQTRGVGETRVKRFVVLVERAIRDLAPHCENKLFLTAPPHNVYRESFSALLDNQRFTPGTAPDRKQLDAIMVRQLKTDPALAVRWDGSTRSPPRDPEPIEVPYTDDERGCPTALRQYTKLRSNRATDNTERFATAFVLKSLKKWLFSSPAASLRVNLVYRRSYYQAAHTRIPYSNRNAGRDCCILLTNAGS